MFADCHKNPLFPLFLYFHIFCFTLSPTLSALPTTPVQPP